MAKLKVVPLTLQEANDYVYDHHRHNKPVTGHRFSIGAILDKGDILGGAIVGRPVARALDDQVTAEINRVCVAEDSPKNVCSFLYGRCWRIWQQMGGERMLTYTLSTEPGSSLKGAGLHIMGETRKRKKEHLWNTRGPKHKGYVSERKEQEADGQIKMRWEVWKS